MSKQVLIFLLALVVGIFTYEGYINVVVTDSQITTELHKTYELTHELAISYVWYDITIGDIMQRYSDGTITKTEMIEEINIGKTRCHKHLDAYARSAKTYEAVSLASLYKQDSDIDETISSIISSADNTEIIDSKITALYNATRVILETINYTIATRARYIKCLNENIQNDNEHLRGYLINTFTMSLVLFTASLIKLKKLEPLHKHTNVHPVKA